MENSLLEIELVHYIVILMWIPLVLQVKQQHLRGLNGL